VGRFDGDGALDLAMANNNPEGHLSLYRNLLPPARARRSVQVLVLDDKGHYTRAGSEVRIYAPGTRKVLSKNLSLLRTEVFQNHFPAGTWAAVLSNPSLARKKCSALSEDESAPDFRPVGFR